MNKLSLDNTHTSLPFIYGSFLTRIVLIGTVSSAKLSPHNLTFNRTPLSPPNPCPCYLINTLEHCGTIADANSMSVSEAASTCQGRDGRSLNFSLVKLVLRGGVLELSFSFEDFYLEAAQRCPYTQSLEMFWPRIPFPVHGKSKIKNLEKKCMLKAGLKSSL